MSPKGYRLSNADSVTKRHFFNVPNSCNEYDAVIDLAPYNPLLFRISHKDSGSFYFEGQGVVSSEHYFVDAKSGRRQMTSTFEDLHRRIQELQPVVGDKLLEHVAYNKKERTNFVSTTFSFTWALFFAEMNLCNWNEQEVELIVIDTFAVADRAWVAHRELSRICPNWYGNPTHRKIMNAAYSSQEVIVIDCIPETAIISRMSWSKLRQKLPSWFYCQTECRSSQEIISIPIDKQWQRYVRWQKAMQGRLHQLSAVSPVQWELVSRREAVAFVFSALCCHDITDTKGVLASGGKRTTRDIETLIQFASRSLLEWSRGFSSPSLEAEDVVEIGKLIRSLLLCNSSRVGHSPSSLGMAASSLFEEQLHEDVDATLCRKFGDAQINEAMTNEDSERSGLKRGVRGRAHASAP